MADFGREVTATVSPSDGDLLAGAYLEATLPSLEFIGKNPDVFVRWTDDVGHHLIDFVAIEIGGQRIDRHFGDWLEIWSQLTLTNSQYDGYREMIGQDPRLPIGLNTGLQRNTISKEERKIYVPFQFWFCRNVGLAIPLISLQYSEIRFVLKLKSMNDLVTAFSASNNGTYDVKEELLQKSLINTHIWVDFIYLDTDERRRFAQTAQEYLIEQTQFNEHVFDTSPVSNTDVFFRLGFEHPVKELIWTVSYENRLQDGHAQWSNYTDRSSVDYPNPDGSILALDNFGSISYDIKTTKVLSSATSAMNLRTALNPTHVRPPGAQNPVYSATLFLEGNKRFANQFGTYFNRMQPFRHHTRLPRSPGINVYSFSLSPEMHQPSGTCNFSKIKHAELYVAVKPGVNHVHEAVSSTILSDFRQSRARLRVYALNYNVLRVINGMGGVAYFD